MQCKKFGSPFVLPAALVKQFFQRLIVLGFLHGSTDIHSSICGWPVKFVGCFYFFFLWHLKRTCVPVVNAVDSILMIVYCKSERNCDSHVSVPHDVVNTCSCFREEAFLFYS